MLPAETEYMSMYNYDMQYIEMLLYNVLSASQFILGHFYHCNVKMALTTWFRKW